MIYFARYGSVRGAFLSWNLDTYIYTKYILRAMAPYEQSSCLGILHPVSVSVCKHVSFTTSFSFTTSVSFTTSISQCFASLSALLLPSVSFTEENLAATFTTSFSQFTTSASALLLASVSFTEDNLVARLQPRELEFFRKFNGTILL
jgi:hypothetical protein